MLTTDNGGGGNDYDNTCFTIDAVNQISAGTAPFVGDYVPEGGVLSGAFIGDLANGTWGLQVTDDAGGDTGTLYNWTLTLNDNIPNIGPATTVAWTSDIAGGAVGAGITDPTSATTQICVTQPGLYTLTSYDVNNCWIATDFNISISGSGNAGLDSIINICKESPQIDMFTYLGGTPDANGIWKNANGDVITAFVLADTIVSGSIYEYEVPGTGCVTSAFITINIFELTETHIFDDSDCQAANGSITVNALGNLGPISYSLDNGVTTQPSNIFSGLAGGLGTTYNVLVEDSLGCQVIATQIINDDNFPNIDNIVSTDSDCGSDNAEVSTTTITSGGTQPYTYSIQELASPFIALPIIGLAPSLPTYNLIVEDAFGCHDTVAFTVNEVNFPFINTITNSDSDCGLDNGEVTMTTASGGTAPYTYIVDGITTVLQSLPISNLAPNTFDLILEDAMGCRDTVAFTVNPINPPVITGTPVVNNICNTGADGEIQVNGNNLSFFSIDGGVTVQVSNVFSGLTAGTYSITAYSSDPATTNACATVENNIIITEPSALSVYDLTPALTSCPGDAVVLSVSSTGGMGGAILTWVDGLGNVLGNGSSITINPSTDVTVTVGISEGICSPDSETTTVTMPAPIFPSLISDVTNGCYPVNVEFTNTSTNSGDIQTTDWVFSPNSSASVTGASIVNTTYSEVGIFDVSMTVTSIYGCVYDTTFTQYIEAYDYPQANFTYTPIPPTIYDTEVELHDLSSDDVVQWSWSISGGSPASAATEDVTVDFPQGVPGIYPIVLKVWNAHQCLDSLVGQVEVINDVLIYAPNVFTPDGDEFNETWRVYISGIDSYDFHCTIFNRWGETVWESYDPNAEWSGLYNSDDKIEDGTFVWVVQAKDSYNDKKYEFRGTVSILK